MGDRKQDNSHLMGWAVAYLLFGGIFIWVISTGPISTIACGDKDANCFRDWVGALSGWAGLCAALITIKVMHDQLREQRDQAAYMRGDVPPHIYAMIDSRHAGDNYYPMVSIVVTNVNRRPLRINRLVCTSKIPNVQISVESITVGGQTQENVLNQKIKYIYVHQTLPARDLAGSATSCTIRCHVWYNGELIPISRDPDHWSVAQLQIALHCELLDSRDEEIILKVEANANVMVPKFFDESA